MTATGAHQRAAIVASFLCVLLSVLLTLGDTPRVFAAALPASAVRPPENIALARVAVVRVLTYYDGSVTGGTVPIPVLNPCIADGALVGTTGANLNSLNYVLLPTSAVNPLTPCQGVQAAFKQLYGNASGWNINRIDVLLNAAYTGGASGQPGTIRYAIDPSQILTNGGQVASPLLALPLSVPRDTHDLPLLAVPQPSDPPASGADSILDLGGANAQPVGSDVIAQDQIDSSLYPVSLDAGLLGTQAQAGGAGQAITPGAPEINVNGRLTGMVIVNSQGQKVLAPLSTVQKAIGVISGRPGQLMSLWQQGLSAFYASPPQFAAASSAFDHLVASYPDFAGAVAFQQAARQQTTTVAPLLVSTPQPTAAPTPSGPAPVLAAQQFMLSRRALVISGGLLSILLILFATFMLVRLRRLARSASEGVSGGASSTGGGGGFAADAGVDVESGSMFMEDVPTQPVPVLDAHVLGDQSTLRIPGVKPALTRTRRGMALMPHAWGRTDPGVKRAKDPNQDTIFIARGLRTTGGRVQPYGLFIVADGMGGHLNGREASRLAIECLASSVLEVLTTSLPVDDATLRRLLKEGVYQAARALHERNMNERQDMGTTITAALLVDDMAYIVNVGDSRTYLMSPETGLHQITVDHSVVASLVTAGVIAPEEIYSHPRRNQIYRSLGGEQDEVEPDVFEVPLQAGDKLLLCSDGLWEMVRDPQIESILRGVADPSRAVDLLIREANTNGGEDNIGTIVVRLLEDVPLEAQAQLQVVVGPEISQDSAQE